MKFVLFLIFTLNLSITAIFAEETRQVDQHEHGVGELNIAVDGSLINFEFMLPGADIVGFEYEAKNDEDLAKIQNALLMLENYENIFTIPKNSLCKLIDLDSHLSGDEHDEHEDEHDEHEDEESHTEFYAKYSFSCENINEINQIEFSYFKTFPKSSELEIQFISDKGTSGFEVDAAKPIINIKGLI